MDRNVRSGITPVVAIVLLLMMTVAAAGAAYTWFSQMQSQVQERATTELQTDMEVKDLQCDSTNDEITVAIKNSGSTEVELTSVDVFLRDSTGHLNQTATGLDWTSYSFGQPGEFDQVTITSFTLADNAFYDVEIDFTDAGVTLPAGGCLASP